MCNLVKTYGLTGVKFVARKRQTEFFDRSAHSNASHNKSCNFNVEKYSPPVHNACNLHKFLSLVDSMM